MTSFTKSKINEKKLRFLIKLFEEILPAKYFLILRKETRKERKFSKDWKEAYRFKLMKINYMKDEGKCLIWQNKKCELILTIASSNSARFIIFLIASNILLSLFKIFLT